jgi:hypothetical protein
MSIERDLQRKFHDDLYNLCARFNGIAEEFIDPTDISNIFIHNCLSMAASILASDADFTAKEAGDMFAEMIEIRRRRRREAGES